MRVIVCGAGQVGYQIAQHLAAEGNDVVVVDTSETLTARISESLEVRGVTGFASHPRVLEEAGARDADMLIAATYSDEVNMVACQVAHTIFEVPRKIARVRSKEYLAPRYQDMFQRDHMPIDHLISPEVEVAKVVERRLIAPSAFDSALFLDERVQLLGARITAESPIANTRLRQISEIFQDLEARILAYVRDGRLRVATGDDQLFPGDECYFIASRDHVARALGLFGETADSADRVVMVGAGNIGVEVARSLEKRGARTKLIERDRQRAEDAAETLDRTIVIHGDGLDGAILNEAGIGDSHAVVSLTSDDKVNVLSCALAKEMGCPRAIALTNDPSLAPLARPLAIDAFVNPRATTVSSILRHVRRGRVRGVYALRDGEAEVIEAQVLATSPMAGKRIRELGLPGSAVVGAVCSGDKVVIPSGDWRLQAKDIVVIFVLKQDLKQVEAFFRVSLEYFP